MTDLETPYFEQIPSNSDICVVSQTKNYTSYDLFVLKNNLQQYLYNIFRQKLHIIISIQEQNFQYKITLYLNDGKQNIILTDIQKLEIENEIKQIVNSKTSHILIYSYDSVIINNNHFSENYIRTFLRYLEIPIEYEPQIDINGLKVNLRNLLNYDEIYKKLILDINEQIESFFQQGVVFNPPKNVISDWELKLLYPTDNSDIDSTFNNNNSNNSIIPLYYPTWIDNRLLQKYSTIQQFLISRIHNDRNIYVKIGYNNVIRHHIAKLIYNLNLNPTFENEYLKLEVHSLKLAQKILTLIDNALHESSGEVFILTYTRPYNLIINESIINNLKPKLTNILNSTSYKVADQDNEYVFSVQIKLNSDYQYIRNLLDTYRKSILETMFKLKENNPESIISKKLGGEYKNLSLYELIEQKWIEHIPQLDLSNVLI